MPQRFLIWGLDGYAVVMFFIFLLGSAMFMMGTGCCSNREAGELSALNNSTEFFIELEINLKRKIV